MKNKKYMVLLVDRQKVKFFTLIDGSVERIDEFKNGRVPQKVRVNEEHYYGRGDKILRHIEDHLHRHLALVSQKAAVFAETNHIGGIVIGSHKPLFLKIEKHLPQHLFKKVEGRFVTELKEPFNDILERAKRLIDQIEKQAKIAEK
ncbi:MAG: hypothetical protein WD967_01610 [Candidatus Levyibacteriota bacterium]